MSKAGNSPPSSRNPRLRPKRSPGQGHFLPMSLNFLHLQIGDLPSGCLSFSALVSPHRYFPPEPVFPTSEGLSPPSLCLRGPAWGRCSGSAGGGRRGQQCEGARGGLAAGAGTCPWRGRMRTPPRRLLRHPALAFWSSSGLIFLCHSILRLPTLPRHVVHSLCQGSDSRSPGSATVRPEGCSLASPPLLTFTTQDSGCAPPLVFCSWRPQVACLPMCSPALGDLSPPQGILGGRAAVGARPSRKHRVSPSCGLTMISGPPPPPDIPETVFCLCFPLWVCWCLSLSW